MAMKLSDSLLVTPVLFCAPVFWTKDYWSEETHDWDWVTPETPLIEKPTAVFQVSIDVTVGDVLEAACDSWGITPGPGMLRLGATRRSEFWRFAFVQEDHDKDGVDRQTGYKWPAMLPVVQSDGTITRSKGTEVSFRELIVSSTLGLVTGDILRPYVHPVRPQGTGDVVTQLTKITAEDARAAFALVDSVGHRAIHSLEFIRATLPRVNRDVDNVLDEVGRINLVSDGLKKIRKKKGRHRK